MKNYSLPKSWFWEKESEITKWLQSQVPEGILWDWEEVLRRKKKLVSNNFNIINQKTLHKTRRDPSLKRWYTMIYTRRTDDKGDGVEGLQAYH